jgi:hypothetical protein
VDTVDGTGADGAVHDRADAHGDAEVIGTWRVAGSYVEACSCEAVCPCRDHGSRAGGRSTYGTCDFVLGWSVAEGMADAISLSGLDVVIAGTYHDDEPGSPWRVALFVDDRAEPAQRAALAAIFLGRAGGDTHRNFARAFREVHGVHDARILITHERRRRRIVVSGAIQMTEREPVLTQDPVSCGIPGHDRPGEEFVAEALEVDSDPVRFAFSGRCGFATDFDYRSDLSSTPASAR